MKEQKNAGRRMEEADDTFYGTESVSSACECTGLMPSAAADEAQAEASSELYAIHKPLSKNENE